MSESTATTNLRSLKLSDLPTGEPLPAAICNESGKQLFPAGQTLTPADIEKLQTEAPAGVFVGPEWDEARAPSGCVPPEVIQAIQSRRAMKGDKRIRQHTRNPWNQNLELEIDESGECGAIRQTYRVKTCDISPAGFSFEFPRFVHVGATVRVSFDFLPTKPRLEAIVRNCRHVEGRTHRVGVEFVKAERAD